MLVVDVKQATSGFARVEPCGLVYLSRSGQGVLFQFGKNGSQCARVVEWL